MPLFPRALKKKLSQTLERGKSVLLLGPRQTGKTTLIDQYEADLEITLLISKVRRKYEADPDQLIREVQAASKNLPKSAYAEVDTSAKQYC